MSDTMLALAVTELCKKAELREMPRPHAGADEIVIKTWYSGVSVGTEMWIAFGRRNDYGPVPFINGYQASGEVVEVGEGVTTFALGDAVTVFCNGAHAPYVKARTNLSHKLPSPALAKSAAMFVQPAVGANALNHAGIKSGDNVLITGQGLIGQCTAIIARLRGAYVMASDISPERLQISAAHCADWTIDARSTKVSTAVKQRYPDGVDVVLESTGFMALLDDALESAKKGGKFVFEGFYPDNVQYNFTVPHMKELQAFYPCFIGPYSNQASIIRLMAMGALNMTPLISHTPNWRDSEAIYNALFTPERDRFNGIIIDWRE